MKLRKYALVWLKTSALSLETILTTKAASLMYLSGKFIRFFFFLWFLLRLGEQIEKVSGFDIDQLVTFFLVFNLFDLIGQIFFRGVYWFRQEIVTGEFDLILLKPIGTLFQIMTKRTDVLDIPLFLLVVGMLVKRNLDLTLKQGLVFAVMATASFVLIMAIHVLVVSIGVLTTEVDHTIMIYRDLSSMARVPIDIYIRPIQALLTFVAPIAVIMTFPAKALMGILTWRWSVFGLIIASLFFTFVWRFWRYALSQYSSASS